MQVSSTINLTIKIMFLAFKDHANFELKIAIDHASFKFFVWLHRNMSSIEDLQIIA